MAVPLPGWIFVCDRRSPLHARERVGERSSPMKCPTPDARPWIALVLALLACGCRGSVSCPTGQRFDESGECVATSTCPAGRDPDTGACLRVEDSGVQQPPDGGSRDAELDGDGGCACEPLMCDAAGGCVECLQDSDCPSETNACQAGVCSPCASSMDCTAPELDVCDPASGRCGQCALQTEAVDCAAAGVACDPVDLTCTGATFASLTPCEQCASDGECGAGPLNSQPGCVPFSDGQPERFCLVDSQSYEAMAGEACPAGFEPSPEMRTNTRGETRAYCLSRGSSCAAFRELLEGRSCTAAMPNCESNFCDTSLERCTLDCTLPRDCPEGFRCDGASQLCKPE